ncbi:NAD(P)/FAD-dependent oxidoreductase [Nocardioides panacisoli]|uniref:phytoene desaturase family protein n=1 Tax=Nocardioides panacisoli TaxID=627624 RepID=UPI001C62BA00|nr:NAD(P)/FAD-dependent oxidoreductase [Nocardioides panacisoli]QYJ04304.1 NAD(P)/FAD-dependent oxidoreductase [Nocardioides panacisoli]
MSSGTYDTVIVGGGHNGLTAAAYLARAGQSVLVLERKDVVGGAAVSEAAFPGVDARLSRYSYLVSLLPEQVVDDLDLDLRLVSRATASYTPVVRGGTPTGLFVEHEEGAATWASFRALTGGDAEYAAWCDFYDEVAQLARVVAPSLLGPLPTAASLRNEVPETIWRDLVERPLGEAIERRFADDTVRGVVATDALIGTFASLHDPSLVQNRCFLYHLIGNGTGEWRVPVGGMGAVTDALARAATDAGARIETGVEVTGIRAEPGATEVHWDGGSAVACRVLANIAPTVLRRLLGAPEGPAPEGAQLKINLLLSRLPRLRSGVDPEQAFAGTLHLGEDYSQLGAAYDAAAAGRLPDPMPGEVYCHSLSDPSILGDVPPGTHTLTYFGLHTPASLFAADPAATKDEAVRRALAALDEHLLDPIESCLARDAAGNPCLEAKVPQDVEADLGMPGGHIFHGDLGWPWLADDVDPADLDTPAARWGVATEIGSVLMCGSGSQRGGAVSGLGGYHAARAVLEG